MSRKEKQSEERQERLLAKAFSRSSFRSSSQSAMIERASSVERASSAGRASFVVDSDISERELQRNIRDASESFIAQIEKYVSRMFHSYHEHNMIDYNL